MKRKYEDMRLGTLYKKAASLKAKVHWIAFNEVRIEAPPFHIWPIDHIHELVCWGIADAIERMEQGVERCPDKEDCDWCNDTLRGIFGISD